MSAQSYGSSTGRAYIYFGGLSMNNSADVTMTGESNSVFGNSVSTAGDVNRDGYSDVIVGAHTYASQTGKVYIFLGGASMNNSADITMTGEATANYFGFSVSTAGDVNGDGYSDVIVGAPFYDSYKGKVIFILWRIFYG
ncbi:MAG: FG-GAP repeat protein [Ignavibacteria bacterium]|nr:FG-GAP repeat protein [Ignavibacteria bacterium]